jgi:hypothetical protein
VLLVLEGLAACGGSGWIGCSRWACTFLELLLTHTYCVTAPRGWYVPRTCPTQLGAMSLLYHVYRTNTNLWANLLVACIALDTNTLGWANSPMNECFSGNTDTSDCAQQVALNICSRKLLPISMCWVQDACIPGLLYIVVPTIRCALSHQLPQRGAHPHIAETPCCACLSSSVLSPW